MTDIPLVHEPTLKIIARFHTVEEAERYIAEVLMISDREGVERGDYSIDLPEELVGRLACEPVTRQKK